MDTKKLRQKILDLAIHGKLVPQDPNDEPASVLLERVRAEKEHLIAEGKIKRPKNSKSSSSESHYRNINQPFEIPDSWEWVTLDDLAMYKKGPFGSSLTKSMFVPEGNNTYKVYEQKNAIQKDANLGIYYIPEEKFQELSGFEVLPGDILVSCAGTIGESYVLPNNIKRGIINQALMIIRLYHKDILRFYLDYFDSVLKSTAAKEGKGTAIKNIPPFEILKSYPFPLPPLEEQKRIALKMDNILNVLHLIDSSTDALSDYIRLAKSKILELAMQGKLVPQDPTDEPAAEMLKRINPQAKIITDNQHYPQLPDNWVVTQLEDITDYEQPQPYIVSSTDYSDVYATPVLTAGKSFILGYTNEDTGIFKKVPVIIFDDFTTDSHYVDFPFKVKSSAMKIISVKNGINIEYVSYFMSMTRLVGDTHKRYWISEYSKLPIPLPPLDEQNRIVSRIKEIYSTLDTISSCLNAE